MAHQITGVYIVYSTACSGADQRKYQNFASLAFVRGLHRWPVNSSHKGPVTRKMFPFDDVIMNPLVKWKQKSKQWKFPIFVVPHIGQPFKKMALNGQIRNDLVLVWIVDRTVLYQIIKTSDISRTLVGNKTVDHSDVVGTSPVGAAPTTSSFSA